MRLLKKRKIVSRAHIYGARVFCHIRFIHRRAYRADHQSTRAKCQQGEKVTTIAVRARCVRPAGRAGVGDWVQSTAIRYLFSLRVSMITLDTRPPSSQYVNKCVWHATMQRTKWHRDPVRGRSGPVVEALRAGVRRHQLPPRSERKCTYNIACARNGNYCGR